MKSKQFVAEEEAKRFAIEQQRQGTPFSIDNRIQTTYEKTLAWITERSRQAAEMRMKNAERFGTILIGEPVKPVPRLEPRKPAEVGDTVEDVSYVGDKIVQRIKRIVGV